MKIAIVTPHPVPLALGGAENLWWGLQNHINGETGHQCDIVSIMSPEGSFWDLIASYETFSKLDLSAYDCVISGKYPAWMVEHPNHICYMLHRLRGVYDTYAGAHEISPATPKLRNLAAWLEEGIANPDPAQIPALFERLATLRASDAAADIAFPGPLSRAIIHFLDHAALSPTRMRRYGAISATVARRQDYFPAEAVVDVLYPPPHRDDYRGGEQRYFFTSSRLDRPKRLDLLIEAIKLAKTDLPLMIAGTGPDEARLKALAGDDPRIQFLGYVPDDDMPGYYADALAVPFVPADEDYGLITIEAMKSGKPVITVSDSGGPCEFVVDGETGRVCAPRPQALADAFDHMASDAPLMRQWGAAAREKVAGITWQAVADGLLQAAPAAPAIRRSIRDKLTVATTFGVFPPMNGGQARVFHLYRNLATALDVDIDIVSLGAVDEVRGEKRIAPGVVEISIPRSEAQAEEENAISRQVGGKPVGDIAANALIGLTPAYADALELSGISSKAMIACHPYMVDALRRAAPEKPFWYEAQDVELTLKSAVFGGDPAAAPLLDEVRRAERDCWINAERVFACAQRDLIQLETLYGPTRALLHEVPNGVSIEDIPYTGPAARRQLKGVAGLADQRLAIFVGSWHGPNLEALEQIIALAPKSPATRFAIIGSVCTPFEDRALPENMELLGMVDMPTRDAMLAVADVALNPMLSGSGTNLKMLDYMAAGIPVISTPFGARGLAIKPETHYVQAEMAGFAEALDDLSAMDEDALARMIAAARELVQSEYAWNVIAARFAETISAS